MIKQNIYTYLGTNGTITTPIHLENIYAIQKVKLTADKGYRLTKDNIEYLDSVLIAPEEVAEWKEVKDKSK